MADGKEKVDPSFPDKTTRSGKLWQRRASASGPSALSVAVPTQPKSRGMSSEEALALALTARILIAKYWKTQDLPTQEEWQMKVMDYMELAEMTGRIQDQGEELVEEDWKKFKVYLQKHCKIKEC
ncbi:Hypothetical predicted protein [Podarcis lilfordi]|uniref:Uncharacterized protein n=1 Tax=Podarcis lilfordi TaxID=74358 RepID=A0AA35PNV1_9SAUR|nr:Hypothetical predicted protein [Podarcis lilfordi]